MKMPKLGALLASLILMSVGSASAQESAAPSKSGDISKCPVMGQPASDYRHTVASAMSNSD